MELDLYNTQVYPIDILNIDKLENYKKKDYNNLPYEVFLNDLNE